MQREVFQHWSVTKDVPDDLRLVLRAIDGPMTKTGSSVCRNVSENDGPNSWPHESRWPKKKRGLKLISALEATNELAVTYSQSTPIPTINALVFGSVTSAASPCITPSSEIPERRVPVAETPPEVVGKP